jgi:hypothetical protein
MLRSARLLATLLAVLAFPLGSAIAQASTPPPAPLTSPEMAAIHVVIQAQIEALKRDDYVAAYAVAAPSWKALYPTVDAFSRLVRGRYSQLIRPKTMVFGTVMQTAQGPIQRVFLTGADGKAYVANYSMQRQPDNTWLISGCTVTRDSNSSPI